MASPHRVGVIGASGYTGAELLRLLAGHPDLQLEVATGDTQAGNRVAYTFANPKGDFDFTDAQWDTIAVRAGERATQAPS